MAIVLPLPQKLSSSILESSSKCIREQGVLAVATESSYALAAGVQHIAAIERIATMKGDRRAKPILLLVSSRVQVFQVASAISPVADLLMNRFWPGPLTLILPAIPDLPHSLTFGMKTIGVRQPDCPQLLQILEATGPLTGTSANRSGMAPANTSEDVLQEFGDDVDLILDSGPSPGGRPSTLLNLVGEIRILRQGPISAHLIQEVLTPLELYLQDSTF
ncbi:MAG: L-threonylcarbamoyladenylate synthase [Nitrospirales bacterium]